MFRGSFVALVTPFFSSGRVDWKTLEDLVEWHILEGTDGIVCSGTTGESCTLSDAERKKLTEICVKTAAGRIPIIAGTGTCDTRQTIRLTEMAQRLGAAGCLVVSPYYNKPTQRGCLAHFREVAKVGLPVIAYHNPGRAVFRFTLESIQELGTIPGIVAIKDSTHDLDFIRGIRRVSNLSVFSGEDDITLEIIQAGGVGVISVIGNVIPRGWNRMVHLALSGDIVAAQKLALRYGPLCKGNFIETNPQCVKYLVSQMGKCGPTLRLPLVMPTLDTQKALKRILMEMALPYDRFTAKLAG